MYTVSYQHESTETAITFQHTDPRVVRDFIKMVDASEHFIVLNMPGGIMVPKTFAQSNEDYLKANGLISSEGRLDI